MAKMCKPFVAILLAALMASSIQASSLRKRALGLLEQDNDIKIDQSVIGGTTVTDPAAYPFVATIINSDTGQICGGALVATNKVLTSAYCINNLFGSGASITGKTVKIGGTTLTGGTDYIADCLVIHPLYQLQNGIPVYDFAIITLKSNAPEDSVIVLGSGVPDLPATANQLIFVGFGATASGSTEPSNTLQEIVAPHVPFSLCQSDAYYNQNLFDGTAQFCAGAEVAKGLCVGDGGGVLIAPDVQIGPDPVNDVADVAVGIYSYTQGLPQCGTGFPDVYAAIAYENGQFISEALATGCTAPPTPIPTQSPTPFPTPSTSSSPTRSPIPAPYIARIRNGSQVCAGALIDADSVLMSAYCLLNLFGSAGAVAGVEVVIGGVDANTGTSFTAACAAIHPQYIISNDVPQFDFAVITLATSTGISPLLINAESSIPNANNPELLYIGFDSGSLVQLSVPFVGFSECELSFYPGLVLGAQFCATSPSGEGPCSDDGGGILVGRNVQIGPSIFADLALGVFSYTPQCATGAPDVYAAVSYNNAAFINNAQATGCSATPTPFPTPSPTPMPVTAAPAPTVGTTPAPSCENNRIVGFLTSIGNFFV